MALGDSVELRLKDALTIEKKRHNEEGTAEKDHVAQSFLKKRVRFATTTSSSFNDAPFGNSSSTRQEDPLRALSKSDRKKLWYSRKEIRSTRAHICALNMATGAAAPRTGRSHALVRSFEATETWRGLEHVREGGLLLKSDRRSRFVKSFLFFHKDLGVTDAIALGVFAANKSQEDRQKALALGTQDALEACQIYYAFMTDPNLTKNYSNATTTITSSSSSIAKGAKVEEVTVAMEPTTGKKRRWKERRFP